MTLERMIHLQNNFRKIGREPYETELKSWSVLTSDHTFHNSYKARTIIQGTSMDEYLREVGINGRTIDGLIKTCFQRANQIVNAPYVLGKGTVDAGDGEHAFVMHVESHHHPSMINPHGGAATGVGGVIRDIVALRARVVGISDVLIFGNRDFPFEKLPIGVKHPTVVQSGVVSGIGSYGNNVGLPNIGGAINFDGSNTGNVLVYAGAFGVKSNKISKDTIMPGDAVILAGGRTGYDGIGGVTFASAILTGKSEISSKSAIQIPEPIQKEKLLQACYSVFRKKLDTSCDDLGGAGLVCPTTETTFKNGMGVELYLDKVPLKRPDLPLPVIAISESQERMFLTARQENVQEVLKTFEEENVEATVVGKVLREQVLKLFFKGYNVGEIDTNYLFNPPQMRRVAEWRPQKFNEPYIGRPTDLTRDLLQVLSSPNVASRRPVVRLYDSEVQGNTVTKHFQGVWGKEGPADSLVIKPFENWNGMVISVGTHPRYNKINPYHGFASSLDEAIRNNVASGGRRWAGALNTAGGNPEMPDRWGQMVMMSLANLKYAVANRLPMVNAKDSLWNESDLGPINPFCLITLLGIIPDIRKSITMDAKEPGNLIYIVGRTMRELGGSEYFWVKERSKLGNDIPRVSLSARNVMDGVVEAIDNSYVRSCHDLSDGGLGVAAAEMIFAGDLGADIYLLSVPTVGVKRNHEALFSQSNTRFLIEVRKNEAEKFEKLMREKNIAHSRIGKTRKDRGFTVYGFDEKEIVRSDSNELREAWKTPIM